MTFTVIFMFLLLAGSCERIIADENENCQAIPGIVRMTRGVDITSLNLFPSDLKSVANGFRHSLFELTCTKNRTWTHPAIPNSLYSLPDQVSSINTVPAGGLNMKTEYYDNLNEYKYSLTRSVGFSIDLKIINKTGSFSANSNYKAVKEQILKSNKTIAVTSSFVSTIQVEFRSSRKMKLSDNFLDSVEELPPKFADDPDLYNQVIHKFGTHYFETGHFGGFLYQITNLDNNYFHSSNMQDINRNVQAKFMLFFEFNTILNGTSGLGNTIFNSSSETKFYYYGGKSELNNQHDNFNLKNWSSTISQDPWLFGGVLVPVEDLIRNRTIRKEMKKASLAYSVKAFLEDLKSSIRMLDVILPENDSTKLYQAENILNDHTSEMNHLLESGKVIGDIMNRLKSIKNRAAEIG